MRFAESASPSYYSHSRAAAVTPASLDRACSIHWMAAALALTCAVVALSCSQAVASEIQPQIVNGIPTAAYASVGVLIFYTDATRSTLDGLCSGTLIGCQTFLTAAHCVCPDSADNASSCMRQGLTDPATLQVFLPHAGFFDIDRETIDPDYSFAEAGDVAVLHLRQSESGVIPAPINTLRRPDFGTLGTIVGFGSTNAVRMMPDDTGIKREGPVTTASCINGVPDTTQVCWLFNGAGANTCNGDSGGPLFIDFGSGPLLTGVTSGGESRDCLAPDDGYDTDVFVAQSFITEQAGSDLGPARCGDVPQIGEAAAVVTALPVTFSAAAVEQTNSVVVPAGTQVLRVALNGQLSSGQGFGQMVDNDFDLFVQAGVPPTDTSFDCKSAGSTTFEFCEVQNPSPGTWYIRSVAAQGTGSAQVTVTALTGNVVSCAGDCSGDGTVTIDELVTGVSIALGGTSLDTCTAFDTNGDGIVTVDELVAAVNAALGGCPL